MRASKLLAVLRRDPLRYVVARQVGSHRRLEAVDYPPLTFAFHDRQELSPGLVRKVLTKDVGLTDQEALRLL